MKAEQLRKSILQMAIQGKLVPQDPNDEPASVLLEKIRAEKQKLIKEGKIKKDKCDSVIFKGDDNCYYEKIGNEVKNIDKEIPFEIPDSWEIVRLSFVCWLDDGKKTSNEHLPNLDAKTLRGKSLETYLYSGKVVEEKQKVILVDGENSGEVFVAPFRGYLGSTFKVLGISPLFNVDYVNTILNFYKDLFKGNKIGAAIPHLNKSIFKSLIVGVPAIDEQARIVAAIERYEPLIAEYDKLETEATALDNTIKDKLKKSILQYAIQGKLVPQDKNDEPASVLLERIRAEKKAQLGKKYVDSYIYKGDDNCYYEHINGKDINITNEIPFDLPDSWIWDRLDNLGIYRKGPFGSSLTKDMFVEKSDVSVKVYEQKNAIYKSVDLGSYYISQEKYKTMKSFETFPEDILVSCAGTIGESFVLPVDAPKGIINQALMRIKLFLREITNFYLLYFDYVLKKEAKTSSKGSAIKNIPPFEILKKMLMPIPPLAEQQRIIAKIDEIFSKLQ